MINFHFCLLLNKYLTSLFLLNTLSCSFFKWEIKNDSKASSLYSDSSDKPQAQKSAHFLMPSLVFLCSKVGWTCLILNLVLLKDRYSHV